MNYDVFIGLEIHIHLKTRSKMFCSCRAHYGDEPNSNVCPVCLGYPGVLPRLNTEALRLGYLVAEALGCKLSEKTVFARKNYFYPDMPKNYQISQYADPIGVEGLIESDLGWPELRTIRIHDVHLEEDAGKMIHSGDITLLDFNRAGYPLLEIVSEPDLRSGEETELFLKGFQRLVRYLGVSDGNMEEGSMKCDANISLNHPGAGLGTKVEIKNMNSPRFLRLAMIHEIKRQTALLESGGTVKQETRLWNENRDITEAMRRKEASDDYRYFPEPDLPPFRPDKTFLAAVKDSLTEPPLIRKRRLMTQYGLGDEQAEFIHDEKTTADFFEETVGMGASAVKVAAWLASDVRKLLNRRNLSLQASPLTAERLAGLLLLIEEGRLSGKMGKQVLDLVFERDEAPETIVEAEDLAQINDAAVLEPVVESILKDNARVRDAIRAGDVKQKGWLIGQVMKVTGGRAAPELLQRVMDQKLSSSQQ